MLGWDWAMRRIIRQAYAPDPVHIDQAELERWRRPLRVDGTEGALATMLSNGIQGLQIADLARVRAPATVVFGQHDSSVPVSSGRRVAAVLHAPITIIPGAGHLSQVTHPRAVAAVIARRSEVASDAMRALVPQIVLDEAEEAARSARFPLGSAIEFADLELDSRVGALDRLRAAGADLVGAGTRWLARHLARARARAAQQARRVHGLGRAQPGARLARCDDADARTATSTRGSGGRSRSRSACVPCASASRRPCGGVSTR